MHQNLSVFGTTTIAGSVFVDATISLGQNGIETLGEPLYLQQSKLGNVDILAGTMVIDTSGNVVITGNLAISGDVDIGGVLGVDTIRPRNRDLTLSLATTASPSSTFGSLKVKGNDDATVVEISPSGDIAASGSGTFTKLNITLPDDTASTQSSQTATPSATIGTAEIPAGITEILVPTSKINGSSLIYITPSTPTGNQVLYIKNKRKEEGFTVAIDQPTMSAIQFNWWIIN